MKRIVLTFDVEHPDQPDGDPAAVASILRDLHKLSLKATFFIQGAWARAYPALAKAVAHDGHVVGLHSQWHAPYVYLSDSGIAKDLIRGRETVTRVTGCDPLPWFRLPYGLGADDPRILAELARHGYRNVHWNIDPRDWDAAASPDDVAGAVVSGVRQTDGPCVVVCHAWSRSSTAALSTISRLLEGDGRFVAADELSDEDLRVVATQPTWVRTARPKPGSPR
ncbi:polysaccharide deacetylase family protein [Nonomuraea sp. NPDC050547]|uniref:polysaccharide deacetylase family protein n=1 Tax=unclassified Nonomuraea TaxID=2593643 RepID=UPI0037AB38CF